MLQDKSNPLSYYDSLTDQYFAEKPDLKAVYSEYLKKLDSAADIIASVGSEYLEPTGIRISKQELQLGQASVLVTVPELSIYKKKKKKDESSKNLLKVRPATLADFELIADNVAEAKRFINALKPRKQGSPDTILTMDVSMLMLIDDYFVGQIVDQSTKPALLALIDKHQHDFELSDINSIIEDSSNILCNPALIGLFAFNTKLTVAQTFSLSNKSKVSLLIANCLLSVGDKSKKLQRQIEMI